MDKEKIKLDRMRYVTDKVPSGLALAAVALDVLYFVLIYKINNDYFYNFTMGVSIVCNLLVMLFGFWASIEVKNYHGKFGIFMIALGVVQLIRIAFYPMKAHSTLVLVGDQMLPVMDNATFAKSVAYLVASAACFIVGGLTSIKNSKTLQNYLDSLEKK